MTYDVEVEYTTLTTFEVEAESQEQALERAKAIALEDGGASAHFVIDVRACIV